jgi:hypothetical protein
LADGVERFLPAAEVQEGAALAEILDGYENERRVLIMRLRYIEGKLVKHKRLRAESLPGRG